MFSSGGVEFVVTSQQIRNINSYHSSVPIIKKLIDLSDLQVKITDFTDANGNGGIVLVAYDGRANTFVYRIYYNPASNDLVVEDVNYLAIQVSVIDPEKINQTAFCVRRQFLPNGTPNPDPATPQGGTWNTSGTMLLTPPVAPPPNPMGDTWILNNNNSTCP